MVDIRFTLQALLFAIAATSACAYSYEQSGDHLVARQQSDGHSALLARNVAELGIRSGDISHIVYMRSDRAGSSKNQPSSDEISENDTDTSDITDIENLGSSDDKDVDPDTSQADGPAAPSPEPGRKRKRKFAGSPPTDHSDGPAAPPPKKRKSGSPSPSSRNLPGSSQRPRRGTSAADEDDIGQIDSKRKSLRQSEKSRQPAPKKIQQRIPLNCEQCREAKLKCSRGKPCERCQSRRLDCRYKPAEQSKKCENCRARRRKCDGDKPSCGDCTRLKVFCDYEPYGTGERCSKCIEIKQKCNGAKPTCKNCEKLKVPCHYPAKQAMPESGTPLPEPPPGKGKEKEKETSESEEEHAPVTHRRRDSPSKTKKRKRDETKSGSEPSQNSAGSSKRSRRNIPPSGESDLGKD